MHSTYSKSRFISHKFHVLREEPALYLSHSIRTLAMSIIGIFLPIYIYNLDDKILFNSNGMVNGLLWILLYFMIRSLVGCISIATITNLVFTRLHFKRSFALSSFISILQVTMWILARDNPLFIFAAAFFSGIDLLFYWTPYHIFFVRKMRSAHGKLGNKVGLKTFLELLINSVGPFLGGYLIVTAGFQSTFIVSIILLSISSLPIMYAIKEHQHVNHKIIPIVTSYITRKKYLPYTIANIGFYLEDIIFTIFWPILLFVTISDFMKIGTLTSSSLLLSALLGLLTGKIINKYSAKKVQLVGITINSIVHIVRSFARLSGFIYMIDIADRLNTPVYQVPFISKTYEKSKGLHDSNLLIYREFMIHLSIFLCTSVIFFIIPFFKQWTHIFLLCAGLSVLTYAINIRSRG